MAEKTNVGMAVFVAVITSIQCGLGSDVVAALLFVWSLICHQFVFP